MKHQKKAQVSAPLELVVAVIIMAMSLLIAFYVIESTGCSRCLAEQKGENQKLADAMHTVLLGSSGSKQFVFYKMHSCCGAKVEGLRFAKYFANEFCGACKGGFGTAGCWKLEPVGYDRNGYLVPFTDASVCVDMSESLEILDCKLPAEELVNSPCPDNGQVTISTCDKAYFKTCNDGWAFGGGTCSGNGDVAFKTLQSQGENYLFNINLSKTTVITGVGLEVCAKPLK